MLEIAFFIITVIVILLLYKENSNLKSKITHQQEQYNKLLRKHELVEHTQHNLIKVNAENHEELKKIKILESQNHKLKYLLEKNKIDFNDII